MPKRRALLIDGTNHDGLPRLQNTARDAALVETTLTPLDFETFALRAIVTAARKRQQPYTRIVQAVGSTKTLLRSA